jgi:NAD(P)-dependent dehydrogenase (short-subunit alcohol dehydrogenase family)
MINLDKKVIVVTGGAGLIGREFVRAITMAGGTALIAELDDKAASLAKDAVEKEVPGADVHIVLMDITSKESVVSAIQAISVKFGRIDALVNNAYPRNSNYGRKLEDVEYADFCSNVGMHLGGYFLVSQQFLEYFKKQGSGNIVNMSSIYGVMAPRFEIYEDTSMTMPVEYAAIKSAIIHLSRYFAKYYKGNNIRVNCISPGGVFNNQPREFVDKYNSYSMSKGMLNNSDLSGTLLYLLSDLSQYVTGQNIIVDDGWSL